MCEMIGHTKITKTIRKLLFSQSNFIDDGTDKGVKMNRNMKCKLEFYEKMDPQELVKLAESRHGELENWDRHIRYRHRQFIGKITDKVPEYIENYGRIAKWEDKPELTEHDMRYKHKEIE